MNLLMQSLLLAGALVGASAFAPPLHRKPTSRLLPSSVVVPLQRTNPWKRMSGPAAKVLGKPQYQSSSALFSDIQSAAISFFDSVRTPSTLVGGQAIAALFAITTMVRDPRKLSRTEVFLLRLYHIVSLLSLCLSIVTIITSTSASTMLLVGNQKNFSKAKDVFAFLNTQMQYEFLITRWSFFSSLLLFLIGIANRALLEFQLLEEKRRIAGAFLICSMGSLMSFLVSYINRTLMGPQANFFVLTIDVFKVSIEHSVRSNAPMFIAHPAVFIGSLSPSLTQATAIRTFESVWPMQIVSVAWLFGALFTGTKILIEGFSRTGVDEKV